MAFITEDELKTVAYSYQISEITEADNTIVLSAIATAIQEVKGYLIANNKKEFLDGRLIYDADAIFSATGTNRNELILQYTKVVALWHLLIICNVDMIYEHIKDRYDRVIDFLKKVNKGDVTLDLPLLSEDTENIEAKQPFRFGSRKKFNHD
jgi:phage gp36-like protein